MSEYGRRVTEELVFELASRGVTIISGFMYGVDALAHKTAINAGGNTVAVVAYGIERACLGYMRGLYGDILDSGGLVISEYGGDEPARKFMFPKRNRIIAGLGMGVLVIEAGLKSGSLITAGYATKYKRRLFSVPGSIYNGNSVGTNELIKEGRSSMVSCANDIFRELEMEGKQLAVSEKSQSKIIKYISKELISRDALCAVAKLPISQVNRELTLLVLSGQVIERGGRYCVNNS